MSAKLQDPQFIGMVLACVMAVNIMLSAIKAAMDGLMKYFPKLSGPDAFLGKVLGVFGKVVDWLSANVQH